MDTSENVIKFKNYQDIQDLKNKLIELGDVHPEASNVKKLEAAEQQQKLGLLLQTINDHENAVYVLTKTL